MGLPDGVCRRCGDNNAPAIADLVSLEIVNNPRKPVCEILSIKKGTTSISECDIIVLNDTDTVTIEYEASDNPKGNLGGHFIRLQRGASPEFNPLAVAGVTAAPSPVISNYSTGFVSAPVWTGGTWQITIPAAAFSSCAYNVRVRAWNRQTNGWSAGAGWGETNCEKNRAFTIIKTGDTDDYCGQLGCCEDED